MRRIVEASCGGGVAQAELACVRSAACADGGVGETSDEQVEIEQVEVEFDGGENVFFSAQLIRQTPSVEYD